MVYAFTGAREGTVRCAEPTAQFPSPLKRLDRQIAPCRVDQEDRRFSRWRDGRGALYLCMPRHPSAAAQRNADNSSHGRERLERRPELELEPFVLQPLVLARRIKGFLIADDRLEAGLLLRRCFRLLSALGGIRRR
jgi:hypothetical protein